MHRLPYRMPQGIAKLVYANIMDYRAQNETVGVMFSGKGASYCVTSKNVLMSVCGAITRAQFVSNFRKRKCALTGAQATRQRLKSLGQSDRTQTKKSYAQHTRQSVTKQHA